ncbi:MAG: hypothetical protein ACD_73C00812G0001 [uncultured bacterium]|nr:MAG: hypothetical protein ACD_73C00812G0001 [uncultured bacterium]
MAGKTNKRSALVLSGGGARGAYEAGVLNFIRTGLTAKQGAKKVFDVHCGSSVGAINTCFMAAYADDLSEQGKKIYELWDNLDQDNIYKRNFGALTHLLGRTTKGITSNLFTLNPFNLRKRQGEGIHFRGFLDTEPFPGYLKDIIPFKKIAQNIKAGHIQAVSLTATNISTGNMELFIQKHPNLEYTGEYAHRVVELQPEHAMASAAIPLIFPPVMVDKTYYMDGGLKLNTPLSPAIQLGANHILVIGLHRRYQHGEQIVCSIAPTEHPTLGQMVGEIMNAFFVDRIQYDVEQLTRINRMVEWSEKIYGPDYLDKINTMLINQGIKGDIANRGLKKLKVLEVLPSVDMATIFSECYHSSKKTRKSFTTFEKILLRLLDIDPTAGVDILSYLSFMPVYLKRLMELGYEDAKLMKDQLEEFLTE